LSTINTPPQSHARPDHNDKLDSFSISNSSLCPRMLANI